MKLQEEQPKRGPDDFDLEAWFKRQVFGMELAPERVVRLKAFLEAHGFLSVTVKYQIKVDKYRVIARRRSAAACRNDDEAEELLRRAAAACGAEAEMLIGLMTGEGQVLGTFRMSVPRDGVKTR
jgi:hypothetical protein